MVDSDGRRVSMLSFVEAELSDEDELPSSAVVNGIAGGLRFGALCWFFMLGSARSRSDILDVVYVLGQVFFVQESKGVFRNALLFRGETSFDGRASCQGCPFLAWTFRTQTHRYLVIGQGALQLVTLQAI